MMNLHMLAVREGFGSLWRAQTFVLVRLTSFNWDAGDVRGAIIALALHSLSAACVFGQRQFSLWARNVMRRAWQGARFAAEITDADSMVAAGGR
ncbi:hypothetical protein [Bradyrhizobium canariense]|uniref:Uncharacterized protein n=1 Tax=Bradyrhizobium canariense TaxID=255045 RepID=A0A1H2A017_9BRAD|nr:hypothetical protein [Bradyrhizobium canariense]SDT39273.1 hypothetical protein SAMN05444158_5791 [Bradyrhizobium canariense]